MIRYWPKVLCGSMAVVPILILAGIVASLAWESLYAVQRLGLGHLFSTQFSGIFSNNQGLYGLIPAIWGTFMVALVAVGFALPLSIAMGVLATEFSLGPASRAIGVIMGVLAGVPPIVYAFLSVVFAEMIIRPKFCASAIPFSRMPLPGLTWWNPGMLPWEGSTLLGGMLISLLVLPFMSPMVEDAMRSVPSELKQASLGLGATRWYTFTRIMIPHALPGIVAASTLGLLKSVGDVLIAAWVIGFESGLPTPIFDIFERTVPLAAAGAGLAGGIGEGDAYRPLPASVSYFTGLLLLVIAFGVMAASTALQHRLQSRTAA